MKARISNPVVWLLGAVVIAALVAGSVIGQQSTGETSWSNTDVGRVGVRGGVVSGEQSVTVRGSGSDIWWEADGFHFYHRTWEGDGQVIVRVVGMDKTDPWAKAGLMIREDLSEGSRHAMVAMTPEKGPAFLRRTEARRATRDDAYQAMRVVPGLRNAGFQWRGAAGVEKAEGAIVASTPPRWLKLVRRGDVFLAYDSTDGQTWEWLGTDQMAMGRTVYLGLAVTSHDNSKLCSAEFDQLRVELPEAVLPAVPGGTGTGQGMVGNYHNSRNHSGPAVTRLDRTIDFDWNRQSPVEGVRADAFSARWEGELEAPFTEPYSLQVVSDDRVRLWLNGELIIDEWLQHPEMRSSAMVNLEAGRRYLLRLDFFEDRNRALMKLQWSSPSIPLQAIPQERLYPEITDEDQDEIPDLWERVEGLDPANRNDAEAIGTGSKNNRQKYRSRFATSLSAEPKTDLPSGWLHQDVGRVALEGTAQVEGNTLTVGGAGVDIWGNSDGFHFVYKAWTGDGEIVARVGNLSATDPWAKAGVMIRADLEAESVHGLLALTPGNGAAFVHRTESAGSTTLDQGGASNAPAWIKLVRRGSVISSYTSADGQAWTWLGSESIDLPELVYMGAVVSSRNNATLASAKFHGLELRQTQNPAPAAGSPASGTGLRGTYHDSSTGAIVTRIDPVIDFDWDQGSPASGIGEDGFTVRWEGWLEALNSGEHALHVQGDDGSRLWFDGSLVIDAWKDRANEQSSVKVQLEAGRRYPIQLEFYERTGEAIAKLRWSSPTLANQTIPKSQLYPAGQSLPGSAQSGEGTPDGTASHPGSVPAGIVVGKTLTGLEDGRLPSGSTNATTVVEVSGAAAVNLLGQWNVDGSEIYAVDRRGALEYDLNVSSADIYRLEIEGTSQNEMDLDSGFYLAVTLDGEYLGRTLLDAGAKRVGAARVLTPYLQSGTHRLRLFWDNPRKGRSLRLKAVRLQSLDGADSNGNGIKDWVEARLQAENGVDGGGQENEGVVSSIISPACMEGPGRYLTMMRIRAGEASILPRNGAGHRWYANVPLSVEQETALELSFQNGGFIQTKRLAWKAVNVLASTNLIIRPGDSLLLTARPADGSTGGSSAIDIGEVHYANALFSGVPHRFDSPGTFAVQGSWTSEQGVTQSGSIQVKVVNGNFPASPAVWVGRTRDWSCPDLGTDIVLEVDPRLQVQEAVALTGGGRTLRLGIDAPEDRTILARVSAGGPILSGARVEGFQIYSGKDSDLSIVQKLEEGSQLIQMGVILSPLRTQVRLEVTLVVGGVIFEDGTVVKGLNSSSFSALGETAVRFIRPAGVRTSVCHELEAFDGTEFVGSY